MQDVRIPAILPSQSSLTSPALAHRTCAFAMCLTLLVSACKGEVQSSPSPQVPEIGVMTVTPTSVPDEPEFIGQAEASRIVEIRSQVTGIIQERYFQEGREVKKGDKLASDCARSWRSPTR